MRNSRIKKMLNEAMQLVIMLLTLANIAMLWISFWYAAIESLKPGGYEFAA